MKFSETFNQVFNRVIGHEGEYSYHPNDAGGETMWGITAKTARSCGYKGAMNYMSREQAKEIYFKVLWQPYQCEQLPKAVAFQFFDSAVNHGAGNAARFLQRALEVADDGIIGEYTLKALSEADALAVCTSMLSERLRFYTALKNFSDFGKGWARRIAVNLNYAVLDCMENA